MASRRIALAILAVFSISISLVLHFTAEGLGNGERWALMWSVVTLGLLTTGGGVSALLLWKPAYPDALLGLGWLAIIVLAGIAGLLLSYRVAPETPGGHAG